MSNQTDHCIDVCNQLLRGERSAIETYDQAIAKYAGKPQIPILERIRTEHVQSVSALEQNVSTMGGSPDRDSGAWGGLTKTIQSTANLLGVDSAVQSLMTGERIGEKNYRDALDDEKVMAECKTLIRTELLPRVEEHIRTLETAQESS